MAIHVTDEEAARFARLLEEHGPGLRRVARAYSRSDGDASDLAQEIAIAVWRALPSFRGECGERAFVFRIAHNRGISHAAARRTRDAATPLVDAPSVADERPLADEQLDAARRRAELWGAIGRLAIGHRTVLTLALEGLGHDEIAEVLGTTTNNVAVRLSRARAELRAILGGTR